jgi:hypothetical protein
VPFVQLFVPVFAKNTVNVPVAPGLNVRKALSPAYAESKPAAALAGIAVDTRLNDRAAAVNAVTILRIGPSFQG